MDDNNFVLEIEDIVEKICLIGSDNKILLQIGDFKEEEISNICREAKEHISASQLSNKNHINIFATEYEDDKYFTYGTPHVLLIAEKPTFFQKTIFSKVIPLAVCLDRNRELFESQVLLDLCRHVILWDSCFGEKALDFYKVKVLKGTEEDTRKLTSFPRVIESLISLNKLFLSNHRFDQLSLSKPLLLLTEINLSGNHIKRIDSNFFQFLPKLRICDLSHNKINDIPDLSTVTNLSYLDLKNNNDLHLIPFSITLLPQLSQDLPRILGENSQARILQRNIQVSDLTKPQHFDLSKLYFERIPTSLFSYTNLTSLNLSHNQLLQKIGKKLQNLQSLTELDVSNCRSLVYIDPSISKLTSLTNLSLRNCISLDEFPRSMGGLTNLRRIHFSGSSLLEKKYEKFMEDTRGLLNYLRDFEKGTITWNDVKVVVLGKEATGKTLLTRMLRRNVWKGKFEKFENVSTNGIEVSQILLKLKTRTTTIFHRDRIFLSVFDFAGQQIFYLTHEIFLTARSVFLVVFDASKQDYGERVFYWLEAISTRISSRSFVICVGTHLDKLEGVVVETCKKIEEEIRAKIDKSNTLNLVLLPFCFVSGVTGQGISELREQILNLMQKEKNYFLPEEPASYMRVLDFLRDSEKSKASKFPIISFSSVWKRFLHMIDNESELERALSFLSTRGHIVWIDTGSLRDFIILNPQWLADVFTKFVSFNNCFKNGIVERSYVDSIWSEFSNEKKEFLLGLLEKFEIVYRDNKSGNLVIPSLCRDSCKLSEEKISSIENNSCKIERVFKLKILCFSFFPRLVVSFVRASGIETNVWKSGIHLFQTRTNQEALLRISKDKKTLTMMCTKREKAQSLFEEDLSSKILSNINQLSSVLFGTNYRRIVRQYSIWRESEQVLERNIDKIVNDFLQGKKLTNFTQNIQVEIAEVAPEIIMSWIPRFQFHNQNFQTIGTGAFGKVSKVLRSYSSPLYQ